MAECIELLESKFENLVCNGSNSTSIFDQEISWVGFDQNLEDQKTEVEVLESIYLNEFELLSSASENSRNAFQLAVHVDLPKKPTLVECWTFEASEPDQSVIQTATSGIPEEERPQFSRSESGNRTLTSFEVHHITPVVLSVVFPESYPSQSAPVFSLSCYWLSNLQLSSIANQLEQLCHENQGSPTVYIWADWLHNEIFSFLGIGSIIISDLNSNPGDSDNRVIVEETDTYTRFAEVLIYNFAVLERKFLTETQTCHICYEDDLGSNFFQLKPCLHHFCVTCITEFCAGHVHEGTVGQLSCPDDECKNTISPDVLLKVLGDEQYARWERLMVQRVLERMGDIVWCPRCSNPVVQDETDESLGVCPQCLFAFCTECNDPWHPGELCKELRTEENRKMMKQQRKADAVTSRDLAEVRADMYRRFQERQMTIGRDPKKKYKKCPACKVQIEKAGGCNKMTCRCGQMFCWICGSKVTGYDHFNRNCILFVNTTPVQVTPPEVTFHDGYVAYRAALMRNADAKQQKCPRCRNKSVKSSRLNLVKCWFCKGHFCIQCGADLSKLGQPTSHYHISKSCTQHSDE